MTVELTPQEATLENDADNQQARDNAAQTIKEVIETGFKNYNAGNHFTYRTVGDALCTLRDGKYYRELGFKTVDDAVKDLGKSRSICYAMMDYHEVITPLLDAHPGIMNINVTNICKYIIPAIRAKSNIGVAELEELLEKVDEIANMADSDQKDEIRRMRGVQTHVDCEHDQTEAWNRCKCCGKFLKVT